MTAAPGRTVDHVLLTRFNLPTQGVEGLIRAQEGWLADRVELFERYCAPSVARQSARVSWIVYLDPDSPGWLLDRLRPLVDQGLFRPVHRTSVSPQELLEDLRATVGVPGDVLITTNLDNDDGLAVDFAAQLQAVTPVADRSAVYLVRGLIKSGDLVFARDDRSNAFCSVREPWEGALTAWAAYHNELSRAMPVTEVDGPPAWLQVVHGANVSNRVRGRLASPRAYESRFPGMLTDVRVPSAHERVVDRLVRVPARTVRDTVRSGARSAGLSVLGKERYQDAKLTLSKAQRALRPGRPR